MVLGWHCTKGPASATALCIVCILEHSGQSIGSSNSAECITQSVAIPAVSTRRVPSCILTGQLFTVTEASLKGRGVRNWPECKGGVCVGLKTFEKSSVFFKEMDLYHHTPQWSSSNIACMYQPPACILCTTFFLHSGWLFNEHPGDKTASTRPLYSSHNLQKSSLSTSCNIYLWWRFFNVSLLCTNVSIPARGPRGPLPPDTKALISQTAEMEFNRIGKTGNVYDHIANIKKSTICESSSSTCSWHAYSH